MNSADQIDQLNALRFKIQSRKRNLSRVKREKIAEKETPTTRKGIPKEETYNKYGEAARKMEIDAIWETWGIRENAFSEIPDAILNPRKIFLRHDK